MGCPTCTCQTVALAQLIVECKRVFGPAIVPAMVLGRHRERIHVMQHMVFLRSDEVDVTRGVFYKPDVLLTTLRRWPEWNEATADDPVDIRSVIHDVLCEDPKGVVGEVAKPEDKVTLGPRILTDEQAREAEGRSHRVAAATPPGMTVRERERMLIDDDARAQEDAADEEGDREGPAPEG